MVGMWQQKNVKSNKYEYIEEQTYLVYYDRQTYYVTERRKILIKMIFL